MKYLKHLGFAIFAVIVAYVSFTAMSHLQGVDIVLEKRSGRVIPVAFESKHSASVTGGDVLISFFSNEDFIILTDEEVIEGNPDDKGWFTATADIKGDTSFSIFKGGSVNTIMQAETEITMTLRYDAEALEMIHFSMTAGVGFLAILVLVIGCWVWYYPR